MTTPPMGPSNVNRTLALDIAHDLPNGILGRNLKEHMHMIRTQMPCQNLALPATSQGVKHLAQILTKLTAKHCAAILRNPHHMVFAFPTGML